MTGLLARNSGRLAFVAGAGAAALLALSLTPTIAGGPYFSPTNANTDGAGSGSLGGWGGLACTLAVDPSLSGTPATGNPPCSLFPGNNPYLAVAAVNAPPGGKFTSFDFAAVDSNLGLFFLADRGTASTLNNGIQVLNTRSTDHKFQMFNQPSDAVPG